MSDKLFEKPVQFPQDMHSILSMNINYEKLESVIKFILTMLEKHEQGLRIVFGKSEEGTNEVLNFQSLKDTFDLKITNIEKNVTKNRQKIEEIKSDLESRGDTVETLKYVLTTIDEHNSAILRSEKMYNDFIIGKEKLESDIQNFEKSLKAFNENNDSEEVPDKTQENYSGKGLEKNLNKSFENVKEYSGNYRGKKYKISNQKLLDDSGHIYSQNQKNLETQFIPLRKPKEPNFNSKAFRKPENLEKEEEEEEEEKGKEENVLASSSDKSFRNTPVFNKSPIPQERIKSEKLAPLLPQSTQLAEIQSRLDALEKLTSKPIDPEIKLRIGKLESMYKLIEGIVDACEPLSIKNKDQILHLVRNLKDLESEMTSKLNTEDFDSIRNLVITLASGSSKHDFTTIIPTQEVNKIRLLDKRIGELEKNFSDIVKVYPENIEELILKLRRIEQKLELKVSEHQLEPMYKTFEDLTEKINAFKLTEKPQAEQRKNTVKPIDNLVLNSINKRISAYEDQIKSLNAPTGIDLSQLWEEIKKNWQGLQGVKILVDDIKKQELAKRTELSTKLEITEKEILKKLEESYKRAVSEVTERCSVLYASRKDLKKITRELESSVKIEMNRSRPEGDDAMIAKKPLGGWSCASCEKKLERLAGRVPSHSPWKKMPLRDVSERMLKAGLGYSKMLTSLQVETLRTKNEAEDSLLYTSRHSDRSLTPHL